jgi:hypothetical protein
MLAKTGWAWPANQKPTTSLPLGPAAAQQLADGLRLVGQRSGVGGVELLGALGRDLVDERAEVVAGPGELVRVEGLLRASEALPSRMDAARSSAASDACAAADSRRSGRPRSIR